MKESHKKLLQQFSRMAEEGLFGDGITKSRLEYEKLPPGISTMLKTISDFIESLSAHEPEITQMKQLTCQTLIVAYREAKRKDPEIAENFIISFIQDYPDLAAVSVVVIMEYGSGLARSFLPELYKKVFLHVSKSA